MTGFDPLDSVRSAVAAGVDIKPGRDDDRDTETTEADPPATGLRTATLPPPPAIPTPVVHRPAAPAERPESTDPTRHADTDTGTDASSAAPSVAPEPVHTTSAPAPRPPEPDRTAGGAASDAQEPTRQRGRTRRAARRDDTDTTPGTKKGNKRQVTIHLTDAGVAALAEVKAGGDSTGVAVMDALRATYSWLTEEYGAPVGEAVGPIPAPRRPRRHGLGNTRVLTMLLEEPEAAALKQLADEFQLSISHLVEAALTRLTETTHRPSLDQQV